MTLNKKILFEVDKEKLVGISFSNSDDNKQSILFLHGGGITTSKKNTFYLAKKLLERGFPSFLFDFSGHGESSGKIDGSSLEKYLKEAIEASRFFDKTIQLTVLASSMGAHIAINLLRYVDVGTLILFSPAVYDRKANNVSFGEQFTKVIRKKDSWRESDTFKILESFKGKLLLFIGENDEVIPDGIIYSLDLYSKNTIKKEIIKIPNCSHKIHTLLSKNDKKADLVVNKILEYL